MIRPFLLFLDACVRGPVAEGLRRRGWDFVRAVDLHGEGALDPPLFEHAAVLGRVFVTNDGPLLALATAWLVAGRPFRMIFWEKPDDERSQPLRVRTYWPEFQRCYAFLWALRLALNKPAAVPPYKGPPCG